MSEERTPNTASGQTLLRTSRSLQTLAGIPRWHRRIDVDPHRFRLCVFPHHLIAHLATVAGQPYAAEWGSWMCALVAVDPNHSAAQVAREAMRAGDVTGPQSVAETILRTVGDGEGLGVVTEGQYGD